MAHNYLISMARAANLPPTLDIASYAKFNEEKVGTVYQQIRRNVFPVAVRQRPDGKLFILLADALKFWEDGTPQEQPARIPRAGRNPFGKHGKPGRPSKAESAANAHARAVAAAKMKGQGGPEMSALNHTLPHEQIEQVLALPDALQGIGFEAVVAGRKIENLAKYCRRVQWFQERSCGCVRLDACQKDRDGNDLGTFLELLVARRPEQLSASRMAMLAEMGETVLSALDSGANLGRARGKTPRRGQQIVAAQIRREEEAHAFKQGGRGQGALFGFDGEVPA